MDENRQRFCDWLEKNGAKYPKIDWPSMNTESGIRGGVAKEDIATDEHMIEIPIKLMMAPPIIFADPEVGDLFKSVQDMLHGDLLLTVYIVHELRKGDSSFYSPFLRILPEPGNVSEWDDDQLIHLQDPGLIIRTKNRRACIKAMYKKTIPTMHRIDPVKFPLEDFTYERFKFAWNCVQARAFGRRLPWTAMVPFADCLNHSNVQTKYDYDVQGNGMFRLFPTGDNHYPKGAEVFNSYGRRPNENLLMDYGFTMLDNEWDDVDLCLDVPHDDAHFDLRYNAMFLVGFNTNKKFAITDTELPLKAMMFLRIALMDATQLAAVIERVQSVSAAEETAPSASASANGAKTVRIANNNNAPRMEANLWFGRILSTSLEIKVLSTLRGLLLSLLGEFPTSAAQDMCILDWLTALRGVPVSAPAAAPASAPAPTNMMHVEAAEGGENVGTEVDSSSADLAVTLDSLSLTTTTSNATSNPSNNTSPSEDRALKKLAACTARLANAIPSDMFTGLQALPVESDAYWRLISAVTYRLTRKRILIGTLRRLDDLLAYFNQVELTLSGDDGLASEGESCVAIWRKLVAEPPHATGGPPVESAARRTPTWDYLKRLRGYQWDATNPLQWPEV